LIVFFFFFQAEDGIRDATVTGVQTCALPIWRIFLPQTPEVRGSTADGPRICERTTGRYRMEELSGRERRCYPFFFYAFQYLDRLDRKSTRLNSSHGSISYAVFCLKKKKITKK